MAAVKTRVLIRAQASPACSRISPSPTSLNWPTSRSLRPASAAFRRDFRSAFKAVGPNRQLQVNPDNPLRINTGLRRVRRGRRAVLAQAHCPCHEASWTCGCGGTGRRAGFRFQCRKAWRFESSHPHHSKPICRRQRNRSCETISGGECPGRGQRPLGFGWQATRSANASIASGRRGGLRSLGEGGRDAFHAAFPACGPLHSVARHESP